MEIERMMRKDEVKSVAEMPKISEVKRRSIKKIGLNQQTRKKTKEKNDQCKTGNIKKSVVKIENFKISRLSRGRLSKNEKKRNLNLH